MSETIEGAYGMNEDADFMEIKVKSANGYSDISELYSLLFKDSLVEWC